jgi:hypothetical protein
LSYHYSYSNYILCYTCNRWQKRIDYKFYFNIFIILFQLLFFPLIEIKLFCYQRYFTIMFKECVTSGLNNPSLFLSHSCLTNCVTVRSCINKVISCNIRHQTWCKICYKPFGYLIICTHKHIVSFSQIISKSFKHQDFFLDTKNFVQICCQSTQWILTSYLDSCLDSW